MRKIITLFITTVATSALWAQIEDVSVYQDCSKNGHTTVITSKAGTATVNSASGRTSCEWVQLWEGGPKWATFNVGSTIMDYANLTAGSDPTSGNVTNYNTANVGGLYAWEIPSANGRKTTWNCWVSTGIADVATTLWGSNWNTPTQEQLDTLQNSTYGKTIWTWCDGITTQYVKGCTLKGYKVSGVGAYAENSIFLPAAGCFYCDHYGAVCFASDYGYYQSSKGSDSDHAYCLNFSSDGHRIYNFGKVSGLSVRAVLAHNVVTTENVTITLMAKNCNAKNVITCPKGQKLHISAEETSGYYFLKWSDGNTDNPRQVVVTQDSTFTAEFNKQIDSTKIIDVAVYGECSKNGYNKDFTHIAAVNSSSGRTYCDYVQLWEGGPRWATFNVGATITDYANLTIGADPTLFFSYDDQVPFYNTANVGGLYAWNNPNLNGRKTTWTSSISTGISDVATTLWGSNWKTPTKEQLDTLQNSAYGKTTWTWCNGTYAQYVEGCTLKGYKVSGVGAYAKYFIFLPVAGYFSYYSGMVDNASYYGNCWSSTVYNSGYAYCLGFGSSNRSTGYNNRENGLPVRAVLDDKTGIVESAEDATLILYATGCSTSNTITCTAGQQLNITAVPQDCQQFVRWSDGNTDNPRSVVVTKDSTFTAIFVGAGYQETVKCTVVNESPYGTVSFTGTAIKDSNISLKATAPECSKFVKWSDNDTSNPRNLTVTQDSTLTAIFEKIQFNVSINTSDSIKGKVKMEESLP